jgi:hypothetical protein
MSSLIWPECPILEGSIGELHWATHVWRLLNRMGFGRVQPVYHNRLVSEGAM